MSHDFRTDATHEAYQAVKATGHLTETCRICAARTITEFSHWRIINNRFPYDAIAVTHHMLVPKRHTVEETLSDAEQAELLTLKAQNLSQYDCLIESLPHNKSIPEHHHIHLVVIKENIQ